MQRFDAIFEIFGRAVFKVIETEGSSRLNFHKIQKQQDKLLQNNIQMNPKALDGILSSFSNQVQTCLKNDATKSNYCITIFKQALAGLGWPGLGWAGLGWPCIFFF